MTYKEAINNLKSEYDCGTVGEEPMECPGFETDECFKLKEEFKKKYLGETE